METSAQKEVLLQLGGLLTDFFKKLSGDEANVWIDAFKKFLRKQNPWVKTGVVFKDATKKQGIAMEIAAWIRSRGCHVAIGEEVTSEKFFTPNTTKLGIVSKEGSIANFLPILRIGRRFFLGNLFFENDDVWRFEGYGEKKLHELHALCHALETKFQKKIEFTLMDKAPKYEWIDRYDGIMD